MNRWAIPQTTAKVLCAKLRAKGFIFRLYSILFPFSLLTVNRGILKSEDSGFENVKCALLRLLFCTKNKHFNSVYSSRIPDKFVVQKKRLMTLTSP